MSQPKLAVKVFSTGPTTMQQAEAMGWGDEGTSTLLKGEVAQIQIDRDGHAEYSLRILPNGELILTSYVGVLETMVDRNLRLTPSRKWA